MTGLAVAVSGFLAAVFALGATGAGFLTLAGSLPVLAGALASLDADAGFFALVAALVLGAGFAEIVALGFFDAGPAALVVDALCALGGETGLLALLFALDFAVATGFAEEALGEALASPVCFVCALSGDLVLDVGCDFGAAFAFIVRGVAASPDAGAADAVDLVFRRSAEDLELEEGFCGVVAFMCLRHSAMFGA